MKPDPFHALRQPTTPIMPDRAFAAALRARVEAALSDPEPDDHRSEPVSDTAIRTAPTVEAGATISVTPYLSVDDAAAAIDFYRRAFGARELVRLAQPDGRIGHAEITIGEAKVMLADEFPEIDFLGPRSRGGASVTLVLHVPDVDAVFERAVAAGATVVRPVADQFYGERAGQILDPFGHRWSLQTVTEDVSPEEMLRRASASASVDDAGGDATTG
jgi:PhnB protein